MMDGEAREWPLEAAERLYVAQVDWPQVLTLTLTIT